MATTTRASARAGTNGDPPEWERGAATARARRQMVGRALTEALTERDETGSKETLAMRLSEVQTALRSGDPIALRAAVFEMTVTNAQWLVALDLRRGRAA